MVKLCVQYPNTNSNEETLLQDYLEILKRPL